MSDTTMLAIAVTALVAIGLFSLPSLQHLTSQLRRRDTKPEVYEDDDGKATPEAVAAFSTKVPKAFVILFSIIGLCVSITLAVLSTLSQGDGLFVENWLGVGAWVLLNCQMVSIVMASSRTGYRLGGFSALSSAVLAAVLVAQDNQIAVDLLRHKAGIFAIRVVETSTILALMFASFSLPRRPDVFHDGKLVDGAYTRSLWSRLNWSWPANVLREGKRKNDLDLVDLPRPDHYTRAEETTADWLSRDSKGPLWLSIISAHKLGFAMQWFATLMAAVLTFGPYWCVLQLLRIIEQRPKGEAFGYGAWIWVVWITLTILAQSWVESYTFWVSWGELSIPIRAQLSSLIFMKSMRRKDVKKAGKKETSVAKSTEPTVSGPAGGVIATDSPQVEETEENEEEKVKKSKQAVVNLIGVDAKRVSDFASFNCFFPGSVFRLIVSLALLLDLLGWKALVAGFSTMTALIPVNIFFSKRYSKAQDNLMKVRDEKMGVVSEALQGIRQIKFSALEPQWEKKIGEVRERELGCIWNAFMNDAMLIGCWMTSPIMLAAVSLSVYAAVHGELTPSVAFVSLGVFHSLEVTLSAIPELTTDLLDAWVSVKRIDAYLQGAEIEKNTKDADEVTFDNATIAWPSDDKDERSNEFTLQNVNVKFPRGELSVISGKTGSGKSLMLAAVLGEVDILSGSISVPRTLPIKQRHDSKANKANWILPSSVAFVAQIPWIENATIKNNILFGLPFDEDRYLKTIEVCALKKDIDMFTEGEKTEIGANGINLSGGQKWRITLARAIYSRAGILVLDDIFSAVDAHVGRHIFERCLHGELCVGRTRILVTHHVALVEPKTKYLVELGDGGVLNAGLVSELAEAGTLQQIKSHEQTELEMQAYEEVTAVNSEETSETDGELIGEPLTKAPSKAQGRKYVEEETREQGAIKKHVYATYLQDSGGWFFWLFIIIFFACVQAFTIGRSWWLRIWTGTYQEESISAQDQSHAYTYSLSLQQMSMDKIVQPMISTSDHSLGFYLGIYVLLALVSAILGTVRYYYVFLGSIRASRKIFARLNFVVLRAPLRWLDTVPVGRVLNRFTADFNSVDSHMAYSLAFGFSSLLNLVGVIIAGIFVSPFIIFLAFFLLLISLWYALQYLGGARPVKRLESTTKSPVFETFNAALNGVTTIRSFDRTQPYIELMFGRLDDWSVATWHLWLFNRWMGWRMAVVGSFFASIVAILILLTPDMHSALAGFALAFALDFSGAVMWTIRHYANIELEMNAAERVVEYTELPTESLEGENPPAAWPTEGSVEVNDLVVGYATDLPPVLKGLTFSVKRNERVGVVGRTGAGKSSLTLALFRFLEARSGSIHVDGLDISKIKLHTLRSRLAIIPQDPVLFSGTVRSNLDPFDDHTDAELYDSLRRVHLVTEDKTSPGTPAQTQDTPSENEGANNKNINVFRDLGSNISEGGLNLSQGQRQLLCLARAIVSRPKVMVLDEATSAVDMHTDGLIQRSIREEFGGSTLMVIAHRLSTIADFDRILVLSDGKVAEFGTPRELWECEGGRGVFRGMCEESGEVERLREMCLGGGHGN
ncbi:P-loop containing nucleoside triphosphate hydrolase protein [Pseudomassariella vexata]|uniref:p-loop containing nucleoside triphosphate hydrolase protein n=1 Tax=Pseudomassariella vexata TaxID=1141098 RepID=A0A1Y2EFM5_9PEZI|nr:P-loop containing nucleoside triphosphate hydrolase protein [Pseudomassariella vexata]ORY70217.1 P-loop containing nucleoside triphosphate hydrolase protein [Pseudomassariella vexata]